MGRKPPDVPSSALQDVLLKSRRRCCICVATGDSDPKEGVVTVLDLAVGPTPDNVAYLCLKHHAEFDAGKLDSVEVKSQRTSLYTDVGRKFPGNLPTPKVFISYAWTNDDHKKWVVDFASRLMGDGVEVILDVWDLKEGHDKYKFMERMVSDKTVSKVLAICDSKYAAKAKDRIGGVGTESQIISPEVYEKTDQEKFIPIVRERDDAGTEWVPVFFKGKKYFDFSNDEEIEQSYEALVRNLFGRPELVKPALGRPPAHLLVESAPSVRPAMKLERLKNAVDRNKPGTHAMLQEYFDVFFEGMEDFRLKYDPQGPIPFDELVVHSITDFTPWRDNFLDMLTFVAGYMNDPVSHDKLTVFLEQIAAYANPKDGTGGYEISTDNYRFILYELFLHAIALLIKQRHFDLAVQLMNHEYSVARTFGGNEFRNEGLRAFNDHVPSLDQMRSDRLKTNRLSVVADMIKERATYPKIKHIDLLQTDYLMFVRYFFGVDNGNRYWRAQASIYLQSVGILEIFSKATSSSGFAVLQKLLGVKTIAELASKMTAMLKSRTFEQFAHSEKYMHCHFEQVMNHEAIVRAAK